MAEAVQPSNWGWAADPPAGGTVRIRTTTSASTFTATASSGYVFDHWTFTPYSGSSSAPGQWMPALQQQLQNNLTANPHVSSRFTYDPEEHPEYNQAGIFATAHFVQSGPGPGPTPTSFEVTAFRFRPDILDAYVSLNGTTDQFTVIKDLAPGATVDLDFTTTNPTNVFAGWYRLAPGDPTMGGVLVSTNPHYTTTVRTDGANRYRADIVSPLVIVSAYGTYDGAVSINGENDGTYVVNRNVPIGAPCTISAEPVVESPSSGPQIFLRWMMLSHETGEYVEVTQETEYTFTPDGTQPDYSFAAEWLAADVLTVTADPPNRGSVSRSPEPDAGDSYYTEETLDSPGVTLTATARQGATFLYWCYVSTLLGRDIIVSRNAVTTVNSGHDYIARFSPSHLLVNSDDRSIPVQLVHDPTTNLLVADY